MRVALVHYASPPVIGGVERILGAHARHFARHGHEVLVISQRGDADVRLRTAAAAEEHVAQLAPVLRECDIVFVHNVMTMPFDVALTEALGRLAKENSETRFVAWVHDIAAMNPDLAPAPGVLEAPAEGFEYVAVSAFRAQQWRSLTGFSPRVIANGIDPAEVLGLPETVARFAERMRLFDGRPVLLHPTRLLRRKNVELGLHVIRELRDLDATLLISGAEDPHNPLSQDYAQWLRSECARLGLANHAFFVADHFPVGEAEMAALYRLADALFLPSRQEGFGLPVLEAALHRLPAFVSEIEPLNEISGSNARRLSLTAPASVVAEMVRSGLASDVATQDRKRALGYRWSRIYDVHLGPFLSGK